MNLPNEIDQDVKCPECGNGISVDAEWHTCGSYTHILFERKTIAALRNQLPPNHTAVPTVELERLREMREDRSWRFESKDYEKLEKHMRALDAILAHLPEKKPDHVAVLREMLSERTVRSDGKSHNECLAIKAAIEKMGKP